MTDQTNHGATTMLTKDIQAILTRAMSDRIFADELFANTDQALANYTLTADEIIKLKRLFSLQADGHTSTAPEKYKSFTIPELERDTEDQN
jgi:hypothetical protein